MSIHHLATRFGRNAHQISGREPLDNEALYRHVPSIFANEAHDSRSQRYVYVPTIDIVEGLRREGWCPFFAVQSVPRDGIGEGMRATAREIATRELGLRSDLDIRASLERQVDAERWTEIDRDLSRKLGREGVIDMAPEPGVRPDGDHTLRIGRLRKLERLGLASEIAPGQWTLADNAQTALRELGERGDIIKRMHKAMSDRGVDRGASSYVLEPDPAQPVIGKLVDRGLHDELTGRAYAIVDGIDGRTHHVQFPDIEATGDCKPGAIVELRRFEDRKGRQRVRTRGSGVEQRCRCLRASSPKNRSVCGRCSHGLRGKRHPAPESRGPTLRRSK